MCLIFMKRRKLVNQNILKKLLDRVPYGLDSSIPDIPAHLWWAKCYHSWYLGGWLPEDAGKLELLTQNGTHKIPVPLTDWGKKLNKHACYKSYLIIFMYIQLCSNITTLL